MQKLSLVILVFSTSLFAQDERWNAYSYTFGGGLGGLLTEIGICTRVMVTPEKEKEWNYGPMYFWKLKGQDELVQITNSLSNLSSALALITREMPEGNQRIAITSAVFKYCASEKSTILVADARERVLAHTTKAISIHVAEELAKAAPDLEEHWDGNTWQLVFFVMSQDGAIERHTFSGQRTPFELTRHEVVLVRKEGTFPWGRYRIVKRAP